MPHSNFSPKALKYIEPTMFLHCVVEWQLECWLSRRWKEENESS
jgi:hypothetical protein